MASTLHTYAATSYCPPFCPHPVSLSSKKHCLSYGNSLTTTNVGGVIIHYSFPEGVFNCFALFLLLVALLPIDSNQCKCVAVNDANDQGWKTHIAAGYQILYLAGINI